LIPECAAATTRPEAIRAGQLDAVWADLQEVLVPEHQTYRVRRLLFSRIRP
jgi:hypothetical protein